MNCRKESKTCRLISCLILIIGYFFFELFVGYFCNSISLQADAFHMLSDGISLFFSLIAVRIEKDAADNVYTFGWQRASIVGPLINTVMLQTLIFHICVDAIGRFIEPTDIKDPKFMLIVGAVGLIVNCVALFLLHGTHHAHSHDHHEHQQHQDIAIAYENNGSVELKVTSTTELVEFNQHEFLSDKKSPAATNSVGGTAGGCVTEATAVIIDIDHSKPKKHNSIKAAQLHVLSDLLGSIVVIASALIIWYFPFDSSTQNSFDNYENGNETLIERNYWSVYVDPSLSLVLVSIITFQNFPFLLKLAKILMQTVPKSINLHLLREQICKLDGISSIHDLHVWQLSDGCNIATLHVICNSNGLIHLNYTKTIIHNIKCLFHQMNIHCTTIQIEYVSAEAHDEVVEKIESIQCQQPCVNKECPFNKCCPTSNNIVVVAAAAVQEA